MTFKCRCSECLLDKQVPSTNISFLFLWFGFFLQKLAHFVLKKCLSPLSYDLPLPLGASIGKSNLECEIPSVIPCPYQFDFTYIPGYVSTQRASSSTPRVPQFATELVSCSSVVALEMTDLHRFQQSASS